MNDEIKELLDNWKYVIDNKITVYGETIAFKQIKILLGYITNLQQELKEANDSITWWSNRFKAIQHENELLKEKGKNNEKI